MFFWRMNEKKGNWVFKKGEEFGEDKLAKRRRGNSTAKMTLKKSTGGAELFFIINFMGIFVEFLDSRLN